MLADVAMYDGNPNGQMSPCNSGDGDGAFLPPEAKRNGNAYMFNSSDDGSDAGSNEEEMMNAL